ncbi:MAG: hypothetical protein GY810_23970 [Aureispira sp.]|nr:hypothetical protein [Aureispira sp.]
MTSSYSCKIIQGLNYITKKEIKPVYYSDSKREAILVPITHFGQKEFYSDLTDSIKHWKRNDYRIYYEIIKKIPDEINVDKVYHRKLRWINGGVIPSRETYAEGEELFENAMAQPKWVDMGITETDLNADVSLKEIIEEYERLYGTINLSECDWSTPMDASVDEYECSIKSKNKLSPVTVDYRNEEVVNYVNQNQDKKIVIIYGAAHIKGILKLLKKNRQ